MRKFKFKTFRLIFILLAVVEFLIVLADTLLFRATEKSSAITSTLMDVISLPLSLVSKNLPFYTNEGIFMVILYWILNLLIQTTAIYLLIRVYKRVKNRSRN